MNEFVDLVAQMRNAQNAYFRARKTGHSVSSRLALLESKKMERQVDDFIDKFRADKMQPKLF